MSDSEFAFLSNNLFTSYPFRTPAPVAMLSGSEELDLQKLVADAVIYTNDETQEQLKITTLELTGGVPPTAGSITLEYATGAFVTLDSVTADIFRTEEYGRWVVVEWVKQEFTGPDALTGLKVVCRLLLSKELLEDVGDFDITITDGFLEDSVIKQGPRRVRKAYVKIGTTLIPLGAEKLILESGFNVSIKVPDATDAPGFRLGTDDTNEVRPKTTVLWQAVPGLGKGQFLLCKPRDQILTINGVGPDTRGNLLLKPTECYWWERPLEALPEDVEGEVVEQTGMTVPNALQLNNACSECCSCEAYVAVYENINRLWTRGLAVSELIRQLRTDLDTLIGDYTSGSVSTPTVKVRSFSRAGYSVDVSLIILLPSLEPESKLVVVLALATTPADLSATYIEKSGVMDAPGLEDKAIDPAGSYPSYALEADGLNMEGGGSITWTGSFRVGDSGDQAITRPGASFSIEATLSIDGEAFNTDATSSELKPPEELD